MYDPDGHFAISALIIATFVGSALGAGISAVTQAVENNWDWKAINPELVVLDAVFGAINGALAVSGLGAIGSAVTGGLLNGLQTLSEAAITGELNKTELWVSIALGFAGGFIPSGFNARNLSGIYKTSSAKMLTAQSAKKGAMYSAKKVFVKQTIIKGSLLYVGSTIGASALDYGFDELGWY